MPRYIIERTLPKGFTHDDIVSGSKRSIAAAADMPGLVWIRSYVSEVEGKIYCEYDAPDPESLHVHAKKAQLPIDKVSLVALEVSPSMFR
jgi:hypothetical protein